MRNRNRYALVIGSRHFLARPSIVARVLVLILGALLAGCSEEGASQAPAGDPARGKELIRTAGCGSCHQIPGIDSADGRVGPPLDKLSRRAYLAGVLPNNFENLVRWLEQPREMVPDTAMPDTGLDTTKARHVAAYLYTLK